MSTGLSITKDCDSGVAWFEEAAWNVTSGAEGRRKGLSVPCSAGGVCDESTGICSCRSGMFDGDACDVMACPTCSDQGRCEDMEYFASVSKQRLAPVLSPKFVEIATFMLT